MCFNPIHLRLRPSVNRLTSDGEICSVHKGYAIDVPCGKCEQCLSNKRDGYLIRCLSELDKSCSVAFCTLTYSNKHLPYIYQYSSPVFDENGDVLVPPKRYRRSVWDKTHIQKFFKALNEKIIYKYGTEYLGLTRLVMVNGRRRISEEWSKFLSSFPRPIKYLCVCERGKNNIYKDDKGEQRRGSRRPHYHIIIFCSCDYFTHNSLLSLIKECWPYGLSYNVLLSDKNGDSSRDVFNSLCYVCKYVTKDFTDVSHKLLYNDHDTYLRHSPFVLTSNWLGLNLLDGYNDNQLLYHLVNGITIPGTDYSLERTVQIPRYYSRYTGEYVLADFGKYISSRLVKDEVVSDGHQPIFIENPDKLEYHILHKRKCLQTDFGNLVDSMRKQKKLDEFIRVYHILKVNKEIYYFCLRHSLCTDNTDHYDSILLSNPTNFKSYVLDTYAHKDSDFSDVDYCAFIGVRNFISSMARIKHFESDLSYKINFEKAISNNPQFLCLQPF